MLRREFLMQAHKYDSAKHNVEGWWASEKLDGTRAFWDGGITRGEDILTVPWANIFHPKTGELKKNLKPISTGLWSRYGNPIIAPDWFLNRLPNVLLDGELFAGRGNFQTCRSIVAGNEPGPDWDKISYAVYGSPPFDQVFQDGEIKNPNFHRPMVFDDINEWFKGLKDTGRTQDFQCLFGKTSFKAELDFLQGVLPCDESVYLHFQMKLTDQYKSELGKFMSETLASGGEGVVLRDPDQSWFPKRMKGLLKCKPSFDSEAVITGFTSGRRTEKGSKLLGMIGAIITDFEGKQLEISGLTDAERRFETHDMTTYASEHDGQNMPENFQGKEFKVGDTIEFTYRELSDTDIPKEARFKRSKNG